VLGAGGQVEALRLCRIGRHADAAGQQRQHGARDCGILEDVGCMSHLF
jgi:hypothetical protein